MDKKDIIKNDFPRFKTLGKRKINRLEAEKKFFLKGYCFESKKNDFGFRHIKHEVIDMLNLRDLNMQNVVLNK